MTKRDELTRAVVEAARAFLAQTGREWHAVKYHDTKEALIAALSALDALPAPDAAGEVVEMTIRVRRHGNIPGALVAEGWFWPVGVEQHGEPLSYHLGTIATIRACVPLPPIADVAADVEGV